MINNCMFRKTPVTATLRGVVGDFYAKVACLRNLLSGFVTTLKRLFESVMGTLFCLLLYMAGTRKLLKLQANKFVTKISNDRNSDKGKLHEIIRAVFALQTEHY